MTPYELEFKALLGGVWIPKEEKKTEVLAVAACEEGGGKESGKHCAEHDGR